MNIAGKGLDYPGYGNPCNGCGECCKDKPCAVSLQYGLWRYGAGCKALAFRAGRYWCDVIANPARLSTKLRKIPVQLRVDAIGIAGWCDAKKTGREAPIT